MILAILFLLIPFGIAQSGENAPTTDLDKRLAAHNAGKGARSTRGRDWRLLYAERFKNRGEAMSREWRLKRDRRFRKQVSAQNFS